MWSQDPSTVRVSFRLGAADSSTVRALLHVLGPWRIRRRARGAKRSVDMMLAGIAAANGAVLATRNVKDFAFLDVEVVNPFE